MKETTCPTCGQRVETGRLYRPSRDLLGVYMTQLEEIHRLQVRLYEAGAKQEELNTEITSLRGCCHDLEQAVEAANRWTEDMGKKLSKVTEAGHYWEQKYQSTEAERLSNLRRAEEAEKQLQEVRGELAMRLAGADADTSLLGQIDSAYATEKRRAETAEAGAAQLRAALEAWQGWEAWEAGIDDYLGDAFTKALDLTKVALTGNAGAKALERLRALEAVAAAGGRIEFYVCDYEYRISMQTALRNLRALEGKHDE